MSAPTGRATGLSLYSRTAARSASAVIGEYSTSFAVACRLLGRSVRGDVRTIYSLVRIADEIVDGAAGEAGLDLVEQRRMLDSLEEETCHAIRTGYSTNLIVHAFACTARSAQFSEELTAPFFASMRNDLEPVAYTAESLKEYIYGSAEVIGLMCLAVFLRGTDTSPAQRARLEEGARRLGSAFQKINFLRDLHTDWVGLGRTYFPDVDVDSLSEMQKLELVEDIEADLRSAAAVIPELPATSRTAVSAAHDLFAALTLRVRRTPASELVSTRVRVPNTAKLTLLGRVALTRAPRMLA